MAIDPADFLQRTFSQCGEDTFLTQNFFHEKSDGFYVDVGAHHPYRYSNTALFHERGWRGINIDIDERAISAFNDIRPNDINILSGVAANEGSLTAYIFNEGAVNTFSPQVAEEYKKINGWAIIDQKVVTVKPISQLLDENLRPGQEIDIMDIDVEGMDDEVLRSNDWDKYRPKALLVEIHAASVYNITNNPTVSYLSGKGYEVSGILTLTTIFRLKN